MKIRFAFRGWFAGNYRWGFGALVVMCFAMAMDALAGSTVIIGESEEEPVRINVYTNVTPTNVTPGTSFDTRDTLPEPYSYPRQDGDGIRLCPPGQSCPSYRTDVPAAHSALPGTPRSSLPVAPHPVLPVAPRWEEKPPKKAAVTLTPSLPSPKKTNTEKTNTEKTSTKMDTSIALIPDTPVEIYSLPMIDSAAMEGKAQSAVTDKTDQAGGQTGGQTGGNADGQTGVKAITKKVSDGDEGGNKGEEAGLYSLDFSSNQVQINSDQEEILHRVLARTSEQKGSVEVLAYAERDSDDPSAERRQALKRALSVRGFLVENGLSHERTTLRVIGYPDDGSDSSRVDLRVDSSG